MAAKVKMLKLLHEIRGFAEITNRRPPPRSPGLFLTQIRSHVAQATLPRRKLSVATSKHHYLALPHQVKIHHLKPSPDPVAERPAP